MVDLTDTTVMTPPRLKGNFEAFSADTDRRVAFSSPAIERIADARELADAIGESKLPMTLCAHSFPDTLDKTNCFCLSCDYVGSWVQHNMCAS